MARIPRKNITTSFFHIMTQGLDKSYIFNYEKDIVYYINLINESKNLDNVNVISYCIMNNHAHLLVQSENKENISKFMQRINGRYAMYYNKKYDRVGYVFRDRYKSEGINTEKHLYNCISYIYNNPVKAGLCTKMDDYKFSNYKENCDIKLENFESNYEFIDIENEKESQEDIIKKYIEDNDIDINDLIKDKGKLSIMVRYLKNDRKCSYRNIEKIIGISRETLRRLNKREL